MNYCSSCGRWRHIDSLTILCMDCFGSFREQYRSARVQRDLDMNQQGYDRDYGVRGTKDIAHVPWHPKWKYFSWYATHGGMYHTDICSPYPPDYQHPEEWEEADALQEG